MSTAPDARVVLRPRGVLESVDLGLRFAMAHARPWSAMALWVIVPGFLTSLALRYLGGATWWLTWSVSFALARLCEGPFTVLAGQQALRSDAGVRSALGLFRRRIVSFVLATVGVWLLEAAAALALLIPWVFAVRATAFIPEVVLLEGAKWGAFTRASRVTHGFGGRALGLVLVIAVGKLSAITLAEAALRPTLGLLFDVRDLAESLWEDAGGPYALFGLWLSVPLCAAVRYFAYIDLRTLKEGWDLQRRFQLLSARLAAEVR